MVCFVGILLALSNTKVYSWATKARRGFVYCSALGMSPIWELEDLYVHDDLLTVTVLIGIDANGKSRASMMMIKLNDVFERCIWTTYLNDEFGRCV